MRLLPALLGTLLVPATWAAARVTLPARSALIAARLWPSRRCWSGTRRRRAPTRCSCCWPRWASSSSCAALRRAPRRPRFARPRALVAAVAGRGAHPLLRRLRGRGAGLWLLLRARATCAGAWPLAALPPALVGRGAASARCASRRRTCRAPGPRASRSPTSCAAASRSWRWGCAGPGSSSVPVSSPSSAWARRRWCCWSGAERGPSASGAVPAACGRCGRAGGAGAGLAGRRQPGRLAKCDRGLAAGGDRGRSGARGDRRPPDRSRTGRGALRGVAGHRRGGAPRRTPAA